jgi:hypothetical protein
VYGDRGLMACVGGGGGVAVLKQAKRGGSG